MRQEKPSIRLQKREKKTEGPIEALLIVLQPQIEADEANKFFREKLVAWVTFLVESEQF